MPRVEISQIMTRDVHAVAPDAAFEEVVAAMSGRRLSCLVVCEKQHPVGMISERDLVRVLSEVLADGERPRRASDVMTAPAITISGHAMTDEAMACVREQRIRRLIVVDDEGCLAGLVTQSDLLHAHTLEIDAHRHRLEEIVAARTRELEAANEQLEALSLLDGLLGVGNRRAMEAALEKQHAQCERYDRPYAVALLDVDHFKAYNDRYGHPQADRVLRTLADTLGQVLRHADSLYRYGGEELLMLLPETDLGGALRAAERARSAVEALAIEHADSAAGCVTVSAGVAVAGGPLEDAPADWRHVVTLADQALYRAKHGGRNRVATASPAAPPGSHQRSESESSSS